MAFARPLLWKIPGMRFRKLMGAGKGIGFTREPDWSRYALLAVWEHEADARNFLAESRFMRCYSENATRHSTLILRTLQAHGSWNGTNPFLPAKKTVDSDGPICILTRATIRPSRLSAFWRMVEPVSRDLASAPGLEASIGIGELPMIRQATASVWSSPEKMKDFAYRSEPHRTVIRRTREENWYSEDLFARFEIIESIGSFP